MKSVDKVDFSWDIIRTRRRFEPGDKLLGPAYRDEKFRAYEWFGFDWLVGGWVLGDLIVLEVPLLLLRSSSI